MSFEYYVQDYDWDLLFTKMAEIIPPSLFIYPFIVGRCHSSHWQLKYISLPLEREPALWLPLTNRTQQKWHCVTSRPKPWDAFQFLLLPSCDAVPLEKPRLASLRMRDHVEREVQLLDNTNPRHVTEATRWPVPAYLPSDCTPVSDTRWDQQRHCQLSPAHIADSQNCKQIDGYLKPLHFGEICEAAIKFCEATGIEVGTRSGVLP